MDFWPSQLELIGLKPMFSPMRENPGKSMAGLGAASCPKVLGTEHPEFIEGHEAAAANTVELFEIMAACNGKVKMGKSWTNIWGKHGKTEKKILPVEIDVWIVDSIWILLIKRPFFSCRMRSIWEMHQAFFLEFIHCKMNMFHHFTI